MWHLLLVIFVSVESSRFVLEKIEEDHEKSNHTEPTIEGGVDLATVDGLGVEPFAVQAVPLASIQDAMAPAPLLVLSKGSVVDFEGDVIVNAANQGCLGGGGVDGAVGRAGGATLRMARANLPIVTPPLIRCPTGTAKITIGGLLTAAWVVHAVGPNYFDESDDDGDRLLRLAYTSAMKRSQEVNATTIAFSLLSSGVFRGTRDLVDVLSIGVEAIEEGVYPGLKAVHMVAYQWHEIDALEKAAKRVWAARGVIETSQLD